MGQAPKAPLGLSIASQILLAVQIFAGVLGIVSSVLTYSYIGSDSVGPNPGTVVGAFATVLNFPVFIATVIVFVIWFHRVRSNVEILAPQQGRHYSRGWAIGSWFTPVGWFWIPRSVALDVHRGSQPLVHAAGQPGVSRRVLNSWWILWCAFWGFAVFVGIMTVSFGNQLDSDGVRVAESDNQLRVLQGLAVAETLFRIAAAVALLLLVRQITSMQQLRILQGPGEGHPYAVPLPQQMLAPMPLATAPQYPAAQYPAPQYAAPQYAGQPYPGQPYPGQPYPGQQPVPQAQPLQQPPLPAQPMLPQQPGYVAAQPYQATVPATPAPEPEPTEVAPTDAAPVDAKPVDATPVDATPGTPDAPETAV
ncbi:DUF4328 domain-containing protein [Streptacidiphilus albus]|uniref:DUF4328 domain-containing protein n=1 Tax=Streptacidiphilus albus TaxID=105425 RepID=UPI001364B456|nr:DUF4328 domain-containing protein [Streptacidiphilus albus]